MKKNYYPFNSELLVIASGNIAVIKSTLGHYCGYAAIKNTMIPKSWQGNYDADALQYLNIHGGITFCEKEGEWTVFGFDCAHAGDKNNHKLYDSDYIIRLSKSMRNQILSYARIIKKWRLADRDTKMTMVQKIIDKSEFKNELGFGALIGMLSGASEFGEE